MHDQNFCFLDLIAFWSTILRKYWKGISTIPFFVFGLSLSAQTTAISPYSNLGVGDMTLPNFTRSMTMGGASVGLPQPLNLDLSNPASFSQLELVTLEAGFEGGFVEQRQENPAIAIDNNISRLRYLAVGLPITDWWGSSIGLRPVSFKGYQINNESVLGSDTSRRVTNAFSGSGGLNAVYWGNSFEIGKDLSLGVQAEYIFGSLKDSRFVDFQDRNFLDTRTEDETEVSDLRFQYGLQYFHQFEDYNFVGGGVTFTNTTNLDAKLTRAQYTVLVSRPVDTLRGSEERPAEITLPSDFQAGLSYGKMHKDLINPAWAVNMDVRLSQSSEFRDVDGRAPLQDYTHLELGGFMVPRYTFQSLERSNQYWNIVEYRIGGYWRQTPYMINGEQIEDIGLSIGAGIPLRQRNLGPGEVKMTSLNIGIIAGQRGTTANNLIQERYLKLFLGITFNDKWFIKYKYR